MKSFSKTDTFGLEEYHFFFLGPVCLIIFGKSAWVNPYGLYQLTWQIFQKFLRTSTKQLLNKKLPGNLLYFLTRKNTKEIPNKKLPEILKYFRVFFFFRGGFLVLYTPYPILKYVFFAYFLVF